MILRNVMPRLVHLIWSSFDQKHFRHHWIHIYNYTALRSDYCYSSIGNTLQKRTLISESAKVVRKTNHIWKICRIIVTRFYSQTCYFTVKTLSNFLRPLFIKFCGLCVIWFPSIQPILFEACLFYFENLYIIWYLIGEINKLLLLKYSLHLLLFLQ